MGQIGQGAIQRSPRTQSQSGSQQRESTRAASARVRRLLSYTLSLLAITSAHATSLEYSWDAVKGATSYEYEVYSGSGLKENELVRQDRVREAKVETSLPSGYYFLRLRSIDSNGVAGTWSPAVRVLVKADPPQVRVPKLKEEVEVRKAGHPIYFEWSAVEGATSYEIRLKSKEGKLVSKVVLGTAASVDGLEPGAWSFRVLARVGEQPITQSDEVSFSLKVVQLPRPRFLQPYESDLLHAWESIYVRWSRSVPGEISEIEVMRLDNERGYVFRDRVDGKQEYWLPALQPGRYQITVRDLVQDNENEHVTQTIAIGVEEDPTGHHKQYLGLSVRFSLVGIFGGWNAIKNREFAGNWLNSRITPGFELRVEAPRLFFNRWGLGLENVADMAITEVPTTTGSRSESKTRFDAISRLVGSFSWEPLGASKRVLLKAGFFWRLHQQLRDDNNAFTTGNTQNASPRSSNINVFGLSLGAQMRWGGWHPRYDVTSELSIDTPFLASNSSDGRFASSGVSPMPRIALSGFLRRRLGDEWRIYAGPEVRFDKLTFSETNNRQSTESSTGVVGARFGFEWDL